MLKDDLNKITDWALKEYEDFMDIKDSIEDESAKDIFSSYYKGVMEVTYRLTRALKKDNLESNYKSNSKTIIKAYLIFNSEKGNVEFLVDKPYREVYRYLEENYRSNWETDLLYDFRVGNNIYLRLDDCEDDEEDINEISLDNFEEELFKYMDSISDGKTFLDIYIAPDYDGEWNITNWISVVVNEPYYKVDNIISAMSCKDWDGDANFDYKLTKDAFVSMFAGNIIEDEDREEYEEISINELDGRIKDLLNNPINPK